MADEAASGDVHAAAVTLGHRGGLVGGKRRNEVLTDEEKSEIARKGGVAKASRDRALHRKKNKKLSVKSKLKRTLKKRKSKKKATAK